MKSPPSMRSTRAEPWPTRLPTRARTTAKSTATAPSPTAREQKRVAGRWSVNWTRTATQAADRAGRRDRPAPVSEPAHAANEAAVRSSKWIPHFERSVVKDDIEKLDIQTKACYSLCRCRTSRSAERKQSRVLENLCYNRRYQKGTSLLTGVR